MTIDYYKKYEPFFNSWYIKEQLGEGSFGKVFEIERHDFGSYHAALKAITIPQSQAEVDSVMADYMDEDSVTEHFRQIVDEIVGEFVLMSKLKGNSNIVSYEDHIVVAHEEGVGWDILIRMELLTPLLKHIRTTAISQEDVIKLGIEMCNALELCQKHKIIHRDIKPENIFISDNGHYKLGDFGIARTLDKTTSGLSKKGTYTYMAPEMYKGNEYGATVDIYSLGLVMYRLLNENRGPFLPAHPAQILFNDRENALIMRVNGTEIPPPKNASSILAGIVLKACAFTPQHRYKTPAQMRKELEELMQKGVDSITIEATEVIYDEIDFTEIHEGDQTILLSGTPNIEVQKVCSFCGEKLLDNDAFCTKCGNSVRNSLIVPVSQTSLQSPVVLPIVSVYQQPVAVQPVTTYQQDKKKSPIPMILSIVSVIVLAFGIGVAIFLMMSRSNNNSENAENGGTQGLSEDSLLVTTSPTPDTSLDSSADITPPATPPPRNTPPPTPKETPVPTPPPTPDPYDDIYFIIPDSNIRELSYEDLRGLSAWELRVARNEIYARHGRQFSAVAQDLQDYFNTMPWYIDLPKLGYDGSGQPIEPGLSSLEMSNAVLILEYERRLS